ncbi:MAG: hypothetical protein ACI4IH_05350 [Eubacterium sp.]
MKKLCCVLLCGVLLFMTGCSLSDKKQAETENTAALIDSGKYYKVYDGTLSEAYEIYNADGELVRSDSTDNPLTVSMLTDYTVDISEGVGTGITRHTYYNAEKDIFSEDFFYVICAQEDMIAYIGASQEDTEHSKTLIVQSIFDKDNYYKEFENAFANLSTFDLSTVSGDFSNDFSELTIYYVSEETQEPVSEAFRL